MRAAHVFPTASNVLQRLSQLVVLWFLATQTPASVKLELVAIFGLLSTFAMLSDSGSGAYLLSRGRSEVNVRVVYSAAVLHSALATLGLSTAAIYVITFLDPSLHGRWIWILVALAVTQQLDSLQRVIRSPELVLGDPLAYARPEFFCALLKILAVVAAAFVDRDLIFALPAISAIFLIAASLTGGRRLGVGKPRRGQWRSTLSFGLGGSINALFSQLPLLLAGVVLASPDLAALTILFRLTQALEVAPGTISLQLIPAYRSRRTTWVRDAAAFAAFSAALAGILVGAIPLIEKFLAISLPWGTAVLLSLAFVLRAVNYQLTAWLLAGGRANKRLILMIVMTVALFPAGLILTIGLGGTGAAGASLLMEGALMVALARLGAAVRPNSGLGSTIRPGL